MSNTPIPNAANGETDAAAAAAVLAELSGAVGDGEGESKDDSSGDGVTKDEDAEGKQSAVNLADVPVLKQTQRQQRAAKQRAAAIAKDEEAAAAAHQVLVDNGVQGVITSMNPEDAIPRDADGNPLWYFNPKSQRAVPANEVLNRPDMRARMKLVPCQPPLDQIVAPESEEVTE